MTDTGREVHFVYLIAKCTCYLFPDFIHTLPYIMKFHRFFFFGVDIFITCEQISGYFTKTEDVVCRGQSCKQTEHNCLLSVCLLIMKDCSLCFV